MFLNDLLRLVVYIYRRIIKRKVMDMIQDWMIINKIKMGDPDAWDILVHKYYDSVYFYCVRRCYGDCDIASDLTQDIFLKLVESLPRYRFIGKFQNYLYTMAVNTCNNYLKKRHIEQIERKRQIFLRIF